MVLIAKKTAPLPGKGHTPHLIGPGTGFFTPPGSERHYSKGEILPTRRFRRDLDSTSVAWLGPIVAFHTVISASFTGRFSRQLRVAAIANRNVSNASSASGAGT